MGLIFMGIILIASPCCAIERVQPTVAADNISQFQIGSYYYTVNGQSKLMDISPFIESGRIYLPVRYAADSLGVSDNQIIWDSLAQTVTLMKGEKVIQLRIGSNVLLVNGRAEIMDVSPKVRFNHTLLPVRYAAEALDSNVVWDSYSQTVTLSSGANSNTPVRDERLALLQAAAAYFESQVQERFQVFLEPPYGNPNIGDIVVVIKEMGPDSATVVIGEYCTDNCSVCTFKRNTSGDWVFEKYLDY